MYRTELSCLVANKATEQVCSLCQSLLSAAGASSPREDSQLTCTRWCFVSKTRHDELRRMSVVRACISSGGSYVCASADSVSAPSDVDTRISSVSTRTLYGICAAGLPVYSPITHPLTVVRWSELRETNYFQIQNGIFKHMLFLISVLLSNISCWQSDNERTYLKFY